MFIVIHTYAKITEIKEVNMNKIKFSPRYVKMPDDASNDHQ